MITVFPVDECPLHCGSELPAAEAGSGSGPELPRPLPHDERGEESHSKTIPCAFLTGAEPKLMNVLGKINISWSVGHLLKPKNSWEFIKNGIPRPRD